MNLPGGASAPVKHNLVEAEKETVELNNRHGVRMTVSPYGATVVSLWVPDSSGEFADIVLGYDHPLQYRSDEYYMGAIVGRYANRIAGNEVMIDDRAYKLRSRFKDFHHHGGVEGFNRRVFDVERVGEQGKQAVVFTYTSADGEEGYPGELKLQVKYTLTDENEWIVEYEAVSTKNTIINITQHAYFNLGGHASGLIDQHELQILADHYLPVNKLQIPTGEVAPVAGTVFDFRLPKPIGFHLQEADPQLQLSGGYDHSFVLETQHTAHLKQAVNLADPQSGRTMSVWTTEPSVHFYAGNYLSAVQGKNGTIYEPRSGLCLETQHFPDSPNQPAFPSTLLQAGEKYYSKTVFKFGSR